MKLISITTLVFLSIFQVAFAQDKEEGRKKYAETITKEDLSKHLHILASDKYEGRETGKKGQKMAAEYIAKQFNAYKLTAPVKDSDNPNYQHYDLTEESWGKVSVKNSNAKLEHLKDFLVYQGELGDKTTNMELVFMGYGIPGTGKSMLIAAIATRLKKHCDELEIPFLFHPMPDTLISTFQGGSAEKMVKWMKPLQDPTKLIFAPIDDAENNLQERTAQGVSAGVKEVIGVFLRYTEGAYIVVGEMTLICSAKQPNFSNSDLAWLRLNANGEIIYPKQTKTIHVN